MQLKNFRCAFLWSVIFLLLTLPALGKDPLADFKFEFDPFWQIPAYQVNYGPVVPAYCNNNTGDVFVLNAGVAGLYRCSAASTWTRVISDNDATQAWTIVADEALVMNIATTGWPLILRHAGAVSYSMSFQNANTGVAFADGTRLNLDAAGNFLIVNEEALNIVFANTGVITWTIGADYSLLSAGRTFAQLPAAPGNGMMLFCSDCTVASPCAAAGTGALAIRLNGAWECTH